MAARPITGWAYVPVGAPLRWVALDASFGRALESELPVLDALEDARARWGRSRIAHLVARLEWGETPPHSGAGVFYSKLGPRGHQRLMHSAWALLERDVVDAVLVDAHTSALRCSLLLERAGRAALQLRSSGGDADLSLAAAPEEGVSALVVASAAVEHGLPCGGTLEPDRVAVSETWRVEVRG